MAYYVDLLANKKYGTLYIGVMNDIVRRIHAHKTKVAIFTKKYSVDKLVWFETYDDVTTAIEREKELKKWRRDERLQSTRATTPISPDKRKAARGRPF